MTERIRERYIRLCAAYGVQIRVEHIDCAEQPKFDVKSTKLQHTITLNMRKIAPEDYESLLAYVVSDVLLPRLVLVTKRLIIRRFCMEDAEGCFAFMSDDEGMILDGCKPFHEMNEEYGERMRLFAQRTGQYVIVLKDTSEIVGTVNVFQDDSRAVEAKEIGYAVSPAHQRKGYAFEALSALIDLLQKELKLDMVVAGVLPENRPSIALLKKLGFEREGFRHKALWHEAWERPVDLVYYYRDR